VVSNRHQNARDRDPIRLALRDGRRLHEGPPPIARWGSTRAQPNVDRDGAIG
jgi:hypothetical protein